MKKAHPPFPCAFCQQSLPTLPTTNAQPCPICGAVYVQAEAEAQARAILSPTEGFRVVAVPQAQGPAVYFGWADADELSAAQVATIIGKSLPTTQQHIREGRFPDAHLLDAKAEAAPHNPWRVPRSAIAAYLLAGRKKYTLSKEGRATRGRPPRKTAYPAKKKGQKPG